METIIHLDLFRKSLRDDLPEEWLSPGSTDPLLSDLRHLAPRLLQAAESGDWGAYRPAVEAYRTAFITALEARAAGVLKDVGDDDISRLLLSGKDLSLRRFSPRWITLNMTLDATKEKRSLALIPRHGKVLTSYPRADEWVLDVREYDLLRARGAAVPAKLMDDKPHGTVIRIEGSVKYTAVPWCNRPDHVYDWTYPLFEGGH